MTNGEPDAGLAPDAASADGTVRVQTDLALPGFPHALDVYLPSNAERVVIFLHGGGGTKEMAAYRESGVRLDEPSNGEPKPDTAWLLSTRTAWVFPQGQHLAGHPLAKTWSNYLMTSGVDDVAFLKAMAQALRSGTLAPSIPGFTRVYLAGHSNGGVMAARMWCESPTTFDGYGALSGPPSVELLPSGAHPCAPQVGRPYIAIIGDSDTVLGTKDNWDGAWAVNECLQAGGGATMPNPNLANEETFHRNFRVPALCPTPAGAPTNSATTTTWSDCGGKVTLIRVTGADHCVTVTSNDACVGGLAGGGCTNALDVMCGVRMRDLLAQFFTVN